VILPIILVLGLAVVGYQLGASKRQQPRIRGTLVGADTSAFRWNPRGFWERPGVGQMTYLGLLTKVLTEGKTPSQALLEAAYMEAQAGHNAQAMALIEQLAMTPEPPMTAVRGDLSVAPQEQNDAPPMEDFEDVTARASPPSVPIASQKQIPVPDVPEANWVSFISSLRTKTPDYRSDNYLGSYEHNRRRLRQLGIDESTLTSADGQYNALCKDIADYLDKCQQLIANHVGDVIDVNGKQVPVTLSGLLALLKAAGPKGAEGWLARPEDRTSFKNTTECFLRCNSCF